MVLGDVRVHVSRSGRALNLQTLPHQVQREDAGLGQHAGYHTRDCIARAEWEIVELAQGHAERLVRREEEAHVGHDLGDGGRAAAEETRGPFLLGDVPDRRQQGRVDPIVPLGGEASAEEVERVCGSCSDAACHRARDEGFHQRRKTVRQTRKGLGRSAIGHELGAAVADIKEFGGDVPFPKCLSFCDYDESTFHASPPCGQEK